MKTEILVVDDNADIRFLICNILSEQGYIVRSAANYDQAVNEINGHLKAIHALFNQIMPYIKYIQDRNEFVTNVYNQYVSFIEELKQNGAVLVEAEQKEVIN